MHPMTTLPTAVLLIVVPGKELVRQGLLGAAAPRGVKREHAGQQVYGALPRVGKPGVSSWGGGWTWN